MYRLLLCHRQSHELRDDAFHAHWREQRSRLALELQATLGFTRYAQLHKFPRRNLLYRGVRATRSWIVTAFFTAKQGRDVPSPDYDRSTAVEERWDVVDQFSFASRQDLVERLTSPAGREAAGRLVDDHRSRVRRTAVVVAEELPVAVDAVPRFERIATIFCLRTPPGMTREEMLEYWGSNHRQLVSSLERPLGYIAYDQLHCRSGDDVQEIAGLFGGTGDEFDGVAHLAYRNVWDLVLGFLNPRTQIANFRLVNDEVRFIDGRRSALVLGREFVFTHRA